jgi:predicted phosphohydrolase
MSLENALKDIEYLKGLKGHKVIIRGNHDYWWKSISRIREALPPKMYAVQNDCIRIGNVLVCGTRGWTCPDGANLTEDDKKIYLRETERLKLSLGELEGKRQEGDIAVCMMHFPPFNEKREPSAFTELLSLHKLDFVLQGQIDEIIEVLTSADQAVKLKEVG